MHPLIVDFGFSTVKWKMGDFKGRLKSVYRKTKKDTGYTFGGENYILGEKALLETASSYLRTVTELVDFYPLFTAYAAEKAGIKERDTLVVGLPYDFWESETARLQKGQKTNAIDALKNALSEIKVNGTTYKFNNVHIFPQGLGCIKTALKENPDITGNILGIDIGFNTAIYALYSVDEKELLYGKTFYKKGIHDMAVNLVLPELNKHTPGKSYTPVEINHLIETKKLQIALEQVDLTPEIEKASSEYIEELLNTIVGDLKAHTGMTTFDTVVMAGGGARLVQNRVSSERVKIIILDQPEYANVTGFEIRAKEMEAQ